MLMCSFLYAKRTISCRPTPVSLSYKIHHNQADLEALAHYNLMCWATAQFKK